MNVCEVLVEDLLIPPQSVEVRECIDNWRLLLVLPHCVLPSCQLHPECVITRTVVIAAEQLLRTGDVHCSVRDIDPAELFEKWVRGQITNTAEILLGGLPTGLLGIAQAHFAALAARGASLPQPVQAIVNAIAARAALQGLTSFTSQDVRSIKILSEADPDADVYLRDWADAITLGAVIVMKEAFFRPLVEATGPEVTLPHMLSGGLSAALINAIDLLVHEMIHVRQYQDLGTENFMVNYLLETLVVGYGNDSFEREAYTFAALMADVHEGIWCSETRAAHTTHIEEFGLALEPVTCTAYLEPILPILLGMTW